MGSFDPIFGYYGLKAEYHFRKLAKELKQAILAIKLEVRSPSGDALKPNSSVYIDDYSHDIDEEAMQITILGLDKAPYIVYFPQLVEEYDRRFKG